MTRTQTDTAEPELIAADRHPDLLLSVEDLRVDFRSEDRLVHAVRGVSFSMQKGEAVGIVGESGSGKSVTALATMHLLPKGKIGRVSGRIMFLGRDIISASPAALKDIRGNRIGMVFQEPMTSFNPLMTVGDQILESVSFHQRLMPSKARARVLELLDLVGLPDPAARYGAYPHQLSGGQLQRVMIAMALCNEPDLLIADEPTTALDVTIQAQIVELVARLRRQLGMGLIWITHDLHLIRKVARTVLVMNAGEIVERGPVDSVLDQPSHPYTRQLLAAEPTSAAVVTRTGTDPVVETRGLRVWYPVKSKYLRRTIANFKAVDGVDISIPEGQTVGLVGESGSGKTTIGRAILRLTDADGEIRFLGRTLQGLTRRQLRPIRQQMQIVFQDPYSSLDPRWRVAEVIREGLRINGIGSRRDQQQQVIAALEEVGLDPEVRFRYPHEFSGGQRQRIAIARAIVMKPRLIVLDEPTSALDRSVQSQIISLLRDLQSRHGLSYLFISHDLRVVRALAHQVMILKDGKAVEFGPAEQVFSAPAHPYTRALFDAAFDLKADGSGTVHS